MLSNQLLSTKIVAKRVTGGQMPRAHPKLAEKDAKKILAGESLLSVEDREQVLQIQQFAKEINKEAEPYLVQRHELIKKNFEDNRAVLYVADECESLGTYLEDLEYLGVEKILKSILESQNDGLLGIFPDCQSLDDILQKLSLDANELDSDGNKEKLKEALQNYLDERLVKRDELYDELALNDAQAAEIAEHLDLIREKFKQYEEQNNLELSLDEEFNLTRISRKKDGPEFSVVFAEHNNEVKPFILYRGKHYEGKDRALGKGGFGVVKLAQDFESNKLVACKIQNSQFLPEEAYLKEKSILQDFGRLKGALKRMERDKDYTILTLHFGADLEHYVESASFNESEALKMIDQMVREVQAVHARDLVHRDIKLENFMWDPEGNQLDIIDFGFVKSLEGQESILTRDEAGSEGYQAPEAVNEGVYSKQSDYYALGVTIINMLQDNHPELYLQLKPQLEYLTKEEPLLRASSLSGLSARVKMLEAELKQEKPSSLRGKVDTSTSLSAGRKEEIREVLQSFFQHRGEHEKLMRVKENRYSNRELSTTAPATVKLRS